MASGRIFGWGIIGTGHIAGSFAEDLRQLPNARLAAVLSRSEPSASKFALKHSASTAYTDLAAFLADDAVDIVYVATPNSTHVALALSAMRAGKAVLIEKPAALSAADVELLGQEADRSGTFVMEAMWIRFLPGISEVKRLIESGEIGQVRALRGALSWKNAYDPHGRLFDKSLGGGASLDLGVYLLSLTMHIMGEPDRVSGSWTAAPSGVDIRASYRLHYGDAHAELECGLDQDLHNIFEITGSKGVIRISNPFIRARRVELAKGKVSQALMQAANGVSAAKLMARLPFPGHRIWHFPYVGHGLSFQADALMQALESGKSLENTMLLDSSAAVLRAVSTVLALPPVG